MSQISYDILLDALYTRKLPEALASNLSRRFWLDSDRRLLEISRILWLYWPLAAPLANAIREDGLVFEVAAAIPDERKHARDLKEAVANRLQRVVEDTRNKDLSNLFLYDDIRHRRLQFEHRTQLEDGLAARLGVPADAQVANFSVAILPFVRTMSLYVRHHAPAAMLRGLQGRSREDVLCFYRRDGEVFARDIGQALRDHNLRNELVDFQVHRINL